MEDLTFTDVIRALHIIREVFDEDVLGNVYPASTILSTEKQELIKKILETEV